MGHLLRAHRFALASLAPVVRAFSVYTNANPGIVLILTLEYMSEVCKYEDTVILPSKLQHCPSFSWKSDQATSCSI